ncbi:DUF3618 domain-containing protein [Sphingomonas sp. BAUL-RG-20F-R05-02]|uniref:DUF3618 domain-containing protein n=1 Tax=Sphingomonas sp. BAUL-RG-20F-R05-02 TaxID=2914830 RepID=UPI001F5A6789|nr:DUF3618 domain-containing protein [Sphingomonas sp. BAUL-RG-20F-R05-02]
MSAADENLALAQTQARAAKARLDETVGALRDKVDPRTIARHAADGLREQGEVAAAVAQRNPGVVAAILTAAGVLLIRRPVMALFRRKKKSVPHITRKGAKG